VGQLNRGIALITSREEREQLAELNLIAGKRAKTTTAYASALMYFATGVELLPDDAWERLHDLPSEGQTSKAIIRPICVGGFRFTSASRSRVATDDPRMPSWKAVAAIRCRFRSTAHDSPVTR
jgi:hypothetical protein